MTTPYHYLQNSFDIATQTSLPRCLRISNHYMAALENEKTDVFIAPLYAAYKPKHLDLILKVNQWKAAGGVQEGETLNVAQQYLLLRGVKAKRWNVLTQTLFDNTTPTYKTIFPNNRVDFQTGTLDSRLNALTTLSLVLVGYPTLSALKTEVDAFLVTLNASIVSQKAALSNTTTKSAAAEVARMVVCVAQYGDLGLFMSKYAATPDSIAKYFDFNEMRHANQILFTGTQLKTEEAHFIVKHTFAGDEFVVCANNGTYNLWYYLSDKKTGLPGLVKIIVAPGTSQTVAITDLGDIANAFVMVYNPDPINKGSFEFEIV